MTSFAHPTALLGYPPQHRDHRANEKGWVGYRIGEGVKIEAFVIVEAGIWSPTLVGDETWLMPYVHVGHDVRIGRGCEVAGGTVVAAHSVLGDGVKLGLHTTLKPGVTIGDGARTGCGAVVIRDVPPGETWVGNPARPLSAREPSPEDTLTEDEYDEWERIGAAAGISRKEWAEIGSRWGSPCG